MLVLRRSLAGLLLISLCAAGTAPAATIHQKVAAAKLSSRDGYAPRLLKAASIDESEPNDGPQEADPVSLGDVVAASFQIGGDEDWFLLTSDLSGYLRVTTTSRLGSATDTVVEVFEDPALAPVAWDDDGGLGLFSSVDHVQVDVGSDRWIRVRHFSDLGGDAYSLVLEVGTPPPPVPVNDSVAEAEFVECNKLALGTTVGASDTLPQTGCLSMETAGGDVFYRVELPYSNQLNVQVNPVASGFDPALVLFTDPQDPSGSCLAAIDQAFDGEAELAVYTNEDFESGLTIYVAIDSWAPASAGDFIVDVKCDFVVPTQSTNWSILKSSWK